MFKLHSLFRIFVHQSSLVSLILGNGFCSGREEEEEEEGTIRKDSVGDLFCFFADVCSSHFHHFHSLFFVFFACLFTFLNPKSPQMTVACVCTPSHGKEHTNTSAMEEVKSRANEIRIRIALNTSSAVDLGSFC